ncbi:unnamed protein product [Miscanthus lutarioriparius]|uniref:Uncharacterized protein n=1 Tax=Miscanthus lutarioriparius TaxID=422564 RepID=A0A811ML39_9POAL|nr:unnamed protein product [Miscanthus lutarioriparius]
MSVPAIAVYTSPPGAAVHAPPEHEYSSRGSAPCAAAATPSAAPSSHRHAAAVAGGLSCLFSSPSAAPRATAHEELGALLHDRSDDPPAVVAGGFGGGDYSYPQSSSSLSPFKLRDHLHRSCGFHSTSTSSQPGVVVPHRREPTGSSPAGVQETSPVGFLGVRLTGDAAELAFDWLFSSFVRGAQTRFQAPALTSRQGLFEAEQLVARLNLRCAEAAASSSIQADTLGGRDDLGAYPTTLELPQPMPLIRMDGVFRDRQTAW